MGVDYDALVTHGIKVTDEQMKKIALAETPEAEREEAEKYIEDESLVEFTYAMELPAGLQVCNSHSDCGGGSFYIGTTGGSASWRYGGSSCTPEELILNEEQSIQLSKWKKEYDIDSEVKIHIDVYMC